MEVARECGKKGEREGTSYMYMSDRQGCAGSSGKGFANVLGLGAQRSGRQGLFAENAHQVDLGSAEVMICSCSP